MQRSAFGSELGSFRPMVVFVGGQFCICRGAVLTEDRHGGWRPYRPWRQNHLESGFDIIHPGTGGPSSLFMTGNSWTKH